MSNRKIDKLGKKRKRNPQIAKERGERLKEEIRRRGLTQGEVAESLDMSLSGLTYLLSGRSQINRTMAYALEFKFNIGSDWILEGRGFRTPQIRLRLDPWERMILELFHRKFDKDYLDMVLKRFEWNERGNDVYSYIDLAYKNGDMTSEEHLEAINDHIKNLEALQNERRLFFEQLNRGLPWEAEKDYGGESRMTRRMREFWRDIQPDKHVDPEEGGGSKFLTQIIRPLIMYLHYGENEWNRIKDRWIAHQRVVVEDRFYHLALEAILEVQAEIKKLITATEEQLRFIEEAAPHAAREAKFMSEDDIDQLLKTHNKGESDGTDG